MKTLPLVVQYGGSGHNNHAPSGVCSILYSQKIWRGIKFGGLALQLPSYNPSIFHTCIYRKIGLISACAYSGKWKNCSYALNKGYVLMEHSHTHKYLGTWPILSTCMYVWTIASQIRQCRLQIWIWRLDLLACLQFIHSVSVEYSQPSLILLYSTHYHNFIECYAYEVHVLNKQLLIYYRK